MKNKTLWMLLVSSLFILASCASNSGGTGADPGPSAGASAEAATTPGGSDDKGAGGADTGAVGDAYEMYTQLMSTLSPAPGEDTQFDMDMEVDMNMEVNGETMSVNMSGNIKMIVEDGEIRYSSVMDMGDLGGVMEMRFNGENFLYIINGVEMDLTALGLDMDTMMDQISEPVSMPDFDVNAIKSVETESVSGGEKTTIVIDGAALTSFTLDSMSGMSALAGGLGDVDLNISDVVMEIVTGGGVPKTFNMRMRMEVSSEGEGMTMEMFSAYTFNKFGSGVVIAA